MPEAPSAMEMNPLLQNARWEGMQREERFQIYLDQRDGILFLVVVGKVLQPVPRDVSSHIKKVIENTPKARVVIDLTRCEYLSSPTLGFLVEFQKVCNSMEARLVMIHPTEPLGTIIRLLGIGQLFTMVPSERDAISSLNAG